MNNFTLMYPYYRYFRWIVNSIWLFITFSDSLAGIFFNLSYVFVLLHLIRTHPIFTFSYQITYSLLCMFSMVPPPKQLYNGPVLLSGFCSCFMICTHMWRYRASILYKREHLSFWLWVSFLNIIFSRSTPLDPLHATTPTTSGKSPDFHTSHNHKNYLQLAKSHLC